MEKCKDCLVGFECMPYDNGYPLYESDLAEKKAEFSEEGYSEFNVDGEEITSFDEWRDYVHEFDFCPYCGKSVKKCWED